jgi:WD40 repeat protein
VTLSEDGLWIGVAYGNGFHIVHRPSRTKVEHDLVERSHIFSDGDTIVAFAIADNGVAAVTTANLQGPGRLFLCKSGNGCDPAIGMASGQVVTSLCFLEDTSHGPDNPSLIYSRNDKLLWVEKLRDFPAVKFDENKAGHQEFAPNRIFPSKSGAQFVAVAGSRATFFTMGKDSNTGVRSLREANSTGQIQSLSFLPNGGEVVTSVLVKPDPSVTATLVRIQHHMLAQEHATWICGHQGDDPTIEATFEQAWRTSRIDPPLLGRFVNPPQVCTDKQK